jgi:23S rRNA (uracil1939-C5)-methyltransferase
MTEITIAIERLSFGGSGFGRVNGKACFVPYTAPGDVITAKIVREKRSYLEGELCEILEPSSERIIPPCPYFGLCGGCNWQFLPYQNQLSEKQEIFKGFICRTGLVAEECLNTIVPSPIPYGYRSRIQLKIRKVYGEILMGFYRMGSHHIVDVAEGCLIANSVANDLIPFLRTTVAKAPDNDKIPQLDLAVGENGHANVIIHYIGDKHETMHKYVKNLYEIHDKIVGIYVQSGRKSSLHTVFESEKLSYRFPADAASGLPDLQLEFGCSSFSQINYSQNRSLVSLVCSWLAFTGNEKVLDVYCGNGNFSLPLSYYVSTVIGLEVLDAAITDARRNARLNRVSNSHFYCKDAAEEVKRLATSDEKFDIVLIDPPRSGAMDVVTLLPDLAPKSIVYVSCDPATLARDIGILRKRGYQAVKTTAVDMFPQTYHIESVTLLQPTTERHAPPTAPLEN